MKKLSKSELIDLVNKIRNIEFETTEERDAILYKFETNVPDPYAINLIYRHEPRLTPEEIVEKALAYKPIILTPPEEMDQKNQK